MFGQYVQVNTNREEIIIGSLSSSLSFSSLDLSGNFFRGRGRRRERDQLVGLRVETNPISDLL
jgi:hypothetical protein